MTVPQLPLLCNGHTRPVTDLHFSNVTSDGKYFMISACKGNGVKHEYRMANPIVLGYDDPKDGKPMLRNGQTGDWVGTFLGHKGAVWSAQLTRDALRGVTGSADDTAKVWDTTTGQAIHTLQHPNIVRAVEFSGDGSRVVTGGHSNIVRLFDLYRIGEPALMLSGHQHHVKFVHWDAERHFVISVGDDNMILLFDLRTMHVFRKMQSDVSLTATVLSPSGSQLMYAMGTEVCVCPMDMLTKTCSPDIQKWDLGYPVSALAANMENTRLVAGSAIDNNLYVYARNENLSLLHTHQCHHGPVHCVGFSPDGELYASGSEDGTIRLWQTILTKSYGLWLAIEDTK